LRSLRLCDEQINFIKNPAAYLTAQLEIFTICDIIDDLTP
jgi:hypothetical protein